MFLAVLIIMMTGHHGINIFDPTPYDQQIRDRPNCAMIHQWYSKADHRWHYDNYQMCYVNGKWISHLPGSSVGVVTK